MEQVEGGMEDEDGGGWWRKDEEGGSDGGLRSRWRMVEQVEDGGAG